MRAVFDAAIVGGGPAGAAAARALAAAKRRVLLVDDPRRRGAGGSRRKPGETLVGGARPLLRELGVLAAVEAGPHLPSHGVVAAWGRDEPVASSDAVRNPHGPGWHLDRRRFDADLRAAAGAAGAEVREGRVREVRPTGAQGGAGYAGRWRIATSDGTAFEARWVVDATGRAATVARALGAVRTRDDGLVALAAWYRTAGNEGEWRTLIEAVPDGWWYTAPLPGDGHGGERAVVLHLDAAEAAAVVRRPGAWEERLEETTWIRRALVEGRGDGRPRPLDRPRGAEACGAGLDPVVGDGWIAVGDAALSFDPVSSQGLLDALYTGRAAGRAIDAALSGDPAPLAGYPHRLARIRRAYLEHHRHAYRAEPRWPHRPFWRSRQS